MTETVTIEKQVWESTLRVSMDRAGKIETLQDNLDVKEAMIKNYTAEIETQRQQLAIAIEALKYYKQEHWTHADEYNYFRIGEYTGGWSHAEKALEQIMELEK